MGQLLEGLMMVCFGLSWPFNIVKAYRSRTARGKSVIFDVLLLCGYGCGIASKLLGQTVSYVVIVYFINISMVTVDLCLTLRNKALDYAADRRTEKERAT